MKKFNSFFIQLLFLVVLSLTVNCSIASQNRELTTASSEMINKEALRSNMAKVAGWQMKNFTYFTEGSSGFLHDYGIDAWTNATLYLGMAEWAKVANKEDSERCYNWLKEIGDKNNWAIPANFEQNERYKFYHADELCIGQFYFEMYDVFKDTRMIQSTKERVDRIINNPPDTSMNYKNKQAWTWCDALFMAPPVYAYLAKTENNPKYLEFMDEHFKMTYNHLYNKEYKLFYRDDSYFDKKEDNGKDVFWGRGNGWVAAGLVSILKLLPKDSEYRPFYENLFSEFLPELVKVQDKEHYWHASLLDPESYPSPETSATSLIVYALAYGVNEGLLLADEYLPRVADTWTVLSSFVNEEGKLGWVQPIGADPKKVTMDMTAVYGVGAYLLAGSEIYRIK